MLVKRRGRSLPASHSQVHRPQDAQIAQMLLLYLVPNTLYDRSEITVRWTCNPPATLLQGCGKFNAAI